MKYIILKLFFISYIRLLVYCIEEKDKDFVSDYNQNNVGKYQYVSIEFSNDLSKLSIKDLDGHVLNELYIKNSENSIYSPNLKIGYICKGKNRKIITRSHTPSVELLNRVQNRIYIDLPTNSLIRVYELEGRYYLEGILNNHQILWKYNDDYNNKTAGIHRLQKLQNINSAPPVVEESINDEIEEEKNVFKRQLIEEPQNFDKNREDDMIRVPDDNNTSFMSGRALNTGPAVIEVAIVIDHENSKKLGMDLKKALDYCSVIITATNEFFSTLKLNKISATLAGVHLVDNSEIEKGGYYKRVNPENKKNVIGELLSDFKEWVGSSNAPNLPAFDFIALLTSYNYGSTTGCAYLRGTCKKYIYTGVVKDAAPSWSGLLTFAHELGHNIGAPHDEKEPDKTLACPQADGYLMSYEGHYTPYKYRYSLCSEKLIKEYIQSSAASCLYRTESNDMRTLQENIGRFAQRNNKLDELCKLMLEDQEYTHFEIDPDLTCSTYYCKKSKGSSMTWTYRGIVVGNGFPCGKNGKCKNGYCVGNRKSIITKLDRDKACKEKSEDENTVSDPDFVIFPEWKQCVMIRCILTKVTKKVFKSYQYKIYNIWMGDGAPCGVKGGKCKNGDCLK